MFYLVLIIKIVFQTFNDADSPVHPFVFGFSGGPVEMEVIENEKTNEELAMGSKDLGAEAGMYVVIIRSAKEKGKCIRN